MRAGEGAIGWNRRVWRLAFPIIVSNITVPLLGAVDTAVVGHMPHPYYLGAVAIGAMIFNFLYWGFGFLRMGTTGMTAQAHGVGHIDEVRAALLRGMAIGMATAAALIALQAPLAWGAFGLVQASAAVEAHARDYFNIRIFGAPAALANYVFLGWFLGLHNARAALLIQVWMNGLNIVLDLLFVVVFGWGVPGVALATVIAEYGALLPAVWIARAALGHMGGEFRMAHLRPGPELRRTLALNMDIFVRTICLVFAFAYFTQQGARFGDVTLAANAVLMNFLLFSAHGLDAFAHAVQPLAGGAIGARDGHAFRQAVRVSSRWAVFTAVLFTLIYAVAGGMIIELLTGIDTVRQAARAHMVWAAMLPVAAVAAYQLDGIFIAATRGRTMRNAMAVSLAAFLSLNAVLQPLWGNHGLWAALTAFMVVRGLTLGLCYPGLVRDVAGATDSCPVSRTP